MQIQDLVGEDLEWSQSGLLGSEYELCRGSDVIGTLKFRSAFGSLATASVDLGCWTFKRMGFLQTRATVRTAQNGPEADGSRTGRFPQLGHSGLSARET